MVTIGRRNTLCVLRDTPPGLYLDGGNETVILLPGRYIPKGTKPGDSLDVFVYLDSEDRLVATTETPLAMVGEFAYLQVISVNPQIGAFLNWGLAKDLLLPFREQEKPLRIWDRVLVGLVLDPHSQRIIATTRLNRLLNLAPATYTEGQPVNLLITAQTPLGYNAIVENAHRGLLYHTNLGTPLAIGQKVQGFVRKVRSDGKTFDDASSPQAIRDSFGVSKNAFKQALGALYKKRQIQFLKPGIELVTAPTKPAKPAGKR